MKSLNYMRRWHTNSRDEYFGTGVDCDRNKVIELAVGIVVIRFASGAANLWKSEIDTEWEVLVGKIGFEIIDDLCRSVSMTTYQVTSGLLTSCNCCGEYPRPPIQPMPPALETAAARGPPDVLAIPASMMGYLIPSSLHSGVERVGVDILTCSLDWRWRRADRGKKRKSKHLSDYIRSRLQREPRSALPIQLVKVFLAEGRVGIETKFPRFVRQLGTHCLQMPKVQGRSRE